MRNMQENLRNLRKRMGTFKNWPSFGGRILPSSCWAPSWARASGGRRATAATTEWRHRLFRLRRTGFRAWCRLGEKATAGQLRKKLSFLVINQHLMWTAFRFVRFASHPAVPGSILGIPNSFQIQCYGDLVTAALLWDRGQCKKINGLFNPSITS